MLRASGEVSVGLNQGWIPPGSHWCVPGPRWSHGRDHSMEPGKESSEFRCSSVCLVASEQVTRGVAVFGLTDPFWRRAADVPRWSGVIVRGRPSRLEIRAGGARARVMLPWGWFADWRCVDPG
jgi:hypothetical protein